MNAKQQFLAMAQHDPSILTLRRCTGEDIRRLAPLAGLSIEDARRAFNLCLFQRTSYLQLQLDPAFEPQEHIRLRAKKKLEARARKNAGILQAPMPAPLSLPPVQRVTPTRKPPRLSRYAFDEKGS